MMETTPERSEQPKAIIITFLSTFVSLFMVFLLIFFKDTIDSIIGGDLFQITAAKWLLLFVFILVCRHQLRVIFIDAVYVKSMEGQFEKIVLWLLLFIAIKGSLVLYIFFSYGVLFGTYFMVAYTFLFLVLGVVMLGSQMKSPADKTTKRENINSIVSIIIDIFCLCIWIFSAFEIRSQSSEFNFLVFVLLAISVFIIFEFHIIFKQPFKDRISQFWMIIKR